MSVSALSRDLEREVWSPASEAITVGVDIIELVSSSMYVDPLTAYREYIQNSVDAIEDARDSGQFAGRVDITIDPASRTIRIRDDGIGLPVSTFARRLTAFGGSEKRQQRRRGFRGVGRLAGLGYCQELIFRSQAEGERTVSELKWDGRLLRSLLRASDFRGTLADAVRQATSQRTRSVELAERFFEVELRGVVRHGRDDLLNETAVGLYLAEIGPVPFSPEFKHRDVLEKFLLSKGVRSDIAIHINGRGPLYRPHRDRVRMRKESSSNLEELEFFEISGSDGDPAAAGFVLHHEYSGAIPRGAAVRGLRLRSGNIQVGDDAILADLFPEPRFNAWAMVEVHILDRRIVPNGRRDQYEFSPHLANVTNHLAPLARSVALRCRVSSQRRQVFRRAELLEERILRDLAILKQGAITKLARERRLVEARASLTQLEKVGRTTALDAQEKSKLERRRARLQAQLTRVAAQQRHAAPLTALTPQRRSAFEVVFSLIYDCASDPREARALVQRVLARL